MQLFLYWKGLRLKACQSALSVSVPSEDPGLGRVSPQFATTDLAGLDLEIFWSRWSLRFYVVIVLGTVGSGIWAPLIERATTHSHDGAPLV